MPSRGPNVTATNQPIWTLLCHFKRKRGSPDIRDVVEVVLRPCMRRVISGVIRPSHDSEDLRDEAYQESWVALLAAIHAGTFDNRSDAEIVQYARRAAWSHANERLGQLKRDVQHRSIHDADKHLVAEEPPPLSVQDLLGASVLARTHELFGVVGTNVLRLKSHGRTYADIANHLGLRMKCVTNLVRRIRRTMRREFGDSMRALDDE